MYTYVRGMLSKLKMMMVRKQLIMGCRVLIAFGGWFISNCRTQM